MKFYSEAPATAVTFLYQVVTGIPPLTTAIVESALPEGTAVSPNSGATMHATLYPRATRATAPLPV